MRRFLRECVRGVRQIRKQFGGRTMILLYHRIADAESDPWQLAVSPAHFEEHLQILDQYWEVLSLRALARSIERSWIPRRKIVITFDDGYADNLLRAKPLLEKYDIPATVFIATGYTGQRREFWWDELDRLFIQPGVLPKALDVTVNSDENRWELGEAACYDSDSYQRHRRWRAWEPEPTARHGIYLSLWKMMHPMSEFDRARLRDDLLKWAGSTDAARPSHRVLTAEEIIKLVDDGLIEVGSHTVTHPQLSTLGPQAQSEEITRSKLRLEEIIGRRVEGFAFPYGRDCDYTDETLSIVREAGFKYACTTSRALVQRPVDALRLPRIQVQDVDGEAFSRMISEWMNRE